MQLSSNSLSSLPVESKHHQSIARHPQSSNDHNEEGHNVVHMDRDVHLLKELLCLLHVLHLFAGHETQPQSSMVNGASLFFSEQQSDLCPSLLPSLPLSLSLPPSLSLSLFLPLSLSLSVSPSLPLSLPPSFSLFLWVSLTLPLFSCLPPPITMCRLTLKGYVRVMMSTSSEAGQKQTVGDLLASGISVRLPHPRVT